MTEEFERLTAALADRYAIEQELGRGGMATVYLAEDLRHGRKVAVKVLRPELAAALGPERFVREIQIAARLSHPHILPLHDSGEAGGFLYYVMPYVPGQSLRQKLEREGELPVPDAVRILKEVVDALAKAHAEGVVHRDIKPDNVLLADRHALVMDFGVAKALSEATGREALTTVGLAVGTPTYMAPEQATADQNIDHRADIYAVGAMAYEMLTGTPPFTAPTTQEVLAAHVTEAPKPVAKRRDSVPPALADLVMRCLQKKPADRWQSAADMLPVLEAMATTPSGGVTPTETAPIHTTIAVAKTHWKKALIAGAGVVVALLLIVALATRGGEETAVDPDLIAVFPFAVTGGTEVQYLGEGMVNLFESNLAAGEGIRAAAAQRSIAAWHEAGGASATAEQALATARRLGAGLSLQGNLVASGNELVINASLASTTGDEEIRATVNGQADSVAALVSRLTAQLLALHAGEQADRTPVLADVPPAALRAYLEAQTAYRNAQWTTALENFGRALAIDSSFALAALGHEMARSWVLTAPPSPGLRLAWTHRDKLPERDQYLLDAMRPNYPNPVSWRERIAAAERATRAMPDRAEVWYYLGDRLYHYGWVLGMRPEHVRERAWAAFDRGLALDPSFGPILTHKLDQAVDDNDFALYDSLVDAHPQIAARNAMASLAVAIRRGDSAAVEAWFAQAETATFDDVNTGSLVATSFTGAIDIGVRGQALALTKATTANERLGALRDLRAMYWFSGQPTNAARVHERIVREHGSDPEDFLPIDAALFLDGDTVQANSAARTIARGMRARGIEPGGGLPATGVSEDEALVLCYLGLWRAHRGDTEGAQAIANQLELLAQRGEPDPALHGRVCSLELRALVAEPAARRSLAIELDSIAASGPDIGAYGRNRLNLVLTELFSSLNEPERALGAAMRWDQFATNLYALFREAGRHAVVVGDTALAVFYLDWYLRVRQGAEPHLQAADNELREELARLVGEPR